MKSVHVKTIAAKQEDLIFLGFAILLSISLIVVGCDRGRSAAGKRSGAGQVGLVPESVESGSSASTIATPASDVAGQSSPTTAQPVVSPVAGSGVEYSAAESAYFAGNYAEAGRLFESYIGAHPRSVEGNYMLGLSRWKQGELKPAEAALRQSLELRPEHVKALVNLARVLVDDGRAQEALEPAAKAVDLDPANGAAQRVRGRVFHTLGMTEQAIASYEQALTIDDRDAWALNNLGLLLLEENRFEEAIPPLARATQIGGEVACFHNNLGIALERTGHFGAAAVAYGQALAADSTYSKAATNLARVEGLKEQPGLAEIDLASLGAGFRVKSKPVEEGPVVSDGQVAGGEEGEPSTPR